MGYRIRSTEELGGGPAAVPIFSAQIPEGLIANGESIGRSGVNL